MKNPYRATSLRVALAGAVVWLLSGAFILPHWNDSFLRVRLWVGLLGVVAVATLVTGVREFAARKTRIAGVAGVVTAVVLGAAGVLLWLMAAAPN